MTASVRVDPLLSQHLREVGTDAFEAESQGFTHGWISETVADPYSAAATGLLATEHLRIGTAVAIAFARSPFSLAQSAWELSRASQGRFVLGLGTQVRAHAERRLSVPWSPPVERLREYVLALRAIWRAFQDGGRLHFEGDYYTHTVFNEHFNPGPIDCPDIPIVLSGVNVRMAELAGEVANGLLSHPLHTRAYLESVIWPAIRRGAERSGRDLEGFSVVVPVWVVTGDDDDERVVACDAIRRQIGLFGSTTAYRRVFEASGWPDLPQRLNAAMKEGGPDAAVDLVSDEVVRAVAVVADPQDLRATLDERLGDVADAAMVYAPLPCALLEDGLARHLGLTG